MRYFYKLLAAPSNTSLMVDIMQRQSILFDAQGVGKELPPHAKTMALGILQLTSGTALANAELRRIEHDHKFPIAPVPIGEHTVPHARYVAVLSGQVMCLIGDECPALNTGEIWWIDPKAEAIIVNKSGDDAILLGVTIRMD